MRRAALLVGLAVLAGAWLLAAAGAGMSGHMAAHMAAVAIAAPLVAFGTAGSRADPATRFPSVITPLAMSLVELAVVWGWHLPAARSFASSNALGLVAEQAMFFTAGLLLWSACLGAREAANSARRAAGVGALLLTTMHMTLLGVLIALAPRPLFGGHGHSLLGLDPFLDQQAAGVVMLIIGGGSYLAGGLLLLGGMLRAGPAKAAQS
jgi:putative membrane protein